ncbi:MAG: diguanylate cyclase [Bacteroidota bacterium]
MREIDRLTVLVIDRSTADRTLICECLEQLSEVRVVAAASGAEAISMYRQHAPSLVLLDTVLHDTDGISLAREIRGMERAIQHLGLARWTPIMFLSGVMDEEMLAQGILAGGDDFLYKPISEIVLLAKARAMLRIAAMQRELYETHRKLREISFLDGLTNIPNRRHFDETLAAEWKRCIRLGSPLSIVLGDVDFFKQFNDIYGHQAGDACLQAVASSLNESLFRVEDMVARYGGEEFAAILPGTDGSGAQAVAERMCRSARELCIPHKMGIGGIVSCSFGVATAHPTTDTVALALLQTADAKLYAAKRAGRNRVAVASSDESGRTPGGHH